MFWNMAVETCNVSTQPNFTTKTSVISHDTATGLRLLADGSTLISNLISYKTCNILAFHFYITMPFYGWSDILRYNVLLTRARLHVYVHLYVEGSK